MTEAYKIVDHTYDVVVVGAGGAGLRATMGLPRRACDGLRHQGLPDPQPHGGRAGRHQRRPRQHGRGRLALAHVRHRQGLRLAGRSGRHRVHVPRGAGRRHELEHYGLPFSRTDDGKIYQRPFGGMTLTSAKGTAQRTCAARRPHRPRDAAHALPAVAEK